MNVLQANDTNVRGSPCRLPWSVDTDLTASKHSERITSGRRVYVVVVQNGREEWPTSTMDLSACKARCGYGVELVIDSSVIRTRNSVLSLSTPGAEPGAFYNCALLCFQHYSTYHTSKLVTNSRSGGLYRTLTLTLPKHGAKIPPSPHTSRYIRVWPKTS